MVFVVSKDTIKLACKHTVDIMKVPQETFPAASQSPSPNLRHKNPPKHNTPKFQMQKSFQ